MEGGGAHLVSTFEFVSFFCGIIFVFLVLRKFLSFDKSGNKGSVVIFVLIFFRVDCK